MTNPIPRELMEMEFDEDRAIDNSPPCPANYDSPWSKEFVDGARWQFDQNKAQLEAMRARIDEVATMTLTHATRANDNLREANDLRAALKLAKEYISSQSVPANKMCLATKTLAEIEKLERGGA